ncbi:MAG: hypothetical protein RCO49_06965 [Rickettsia endosymbiont of Argas persicus]
MDLAIRKNMVDKDCSNLSIARQCTLLFINKSSYYYKPQGLTKKDLEIMQVIDEIYTQHPYFGARRMSEHLVPFGITIGRKAVSHYYRIMAIEAGTVKLSKLVLKSTMFLYFRQQEVFE